jgi:Tfp pilus assembly protein PilP
MNRSRVRPFLAAALVLAALVGSAPAQQAQQGQQSPPPPPSDTDSGRVLPGDTAPPSLEEIDQILEGEEEVLSGEGYTYDPGNRRDPFKSLLAAPDRPEFRGPRPDGIPGLLIDEIGLYGIYRTGKGYVAQVKAANQGKSYLLKEGDQLYDGDVVSIGRDEVVFKQIVQDPTALKPFREVVKTLTPKQ